MGRTKMNGNTRNRPRRGKTGRGNRTTLRRDNMTSNNPKKDYYVANALDMTPHPNKVFVSTLRPPVMNPRLKYSVLETSITGSHLTSTAGTALLAVNQGTTDITRVGDRLKVKRVWLTGKVYGNASQTGPVSGRLVVALWNPPAVAANVPVASQVIQASAGFLPYGSYSRDFGDSYQILFDDLYSVNQLTATAEAELFHYDQKCNFDVEFNAAGTAPVTNQLFIWLMSDVSANQPSMNFQSVCWFEDVDA